MTRIERYILYSLPLISIIVEVITSFAGKETKLMAMRDHGIFLVIVYLTIRYLKQVIKFNVFLVLLMLYFIILLAIQGLNLDQYNSFVRFVDAKMLLPFSFIFTSSDKHLKDINKWMIIIGVLFVSSIIAFSVLGIGRDIYGSGSKFRYGSFTYSKIYIGSFLLIALPFIYSQAKDKIAKNALLLLGVLTLLLLVLSMRRTSVIIVLIGAIVYIYYNRESIGQIVFYSVVLFFMLLVSFPLYQDILLKQMAARSEFFNNRSLIDNLTQETRYEETIAVYRERIINPDKRLFLFGAHLFNSPGHYDNGIHGARPLHLDLNVVLHGSGIIGLILFLCFYLLLFVKFQSLVTRVRFQENKLLVCMFLGMFFAHVFCWFSGGMETVTFNMISAIYMGGIMGYFRELALTKNTYESENNLRTTYDNIFHQTFVYQPSQKVNHQRNN